MVQRTGIEEEKWKEIKYNRDENAKNDVGCKRKGQVTKRRCKQKNKFNDERGVVE